MAIEDDEEQKMEFLRGNQLYYKLEEKIYSLMDILNLSFDNTLLLLHYYRWNDDKL